MKEFNIPTEQINAETSAAIEKNKLAPTTKDDITNKQLQFDVSGLPFKTTIYLNFTSSFIMGMEAELDYKNNLWHYVPYDIPIALRDQYNGFKFAIDIFCTDEKISKRRLEKKIKKVCPGKAIEWEKTKPFNLMDWIAEVIKKYPLCNQEFNKVEHTEENIFKGFYNFFKGFDIVLFPENEAENNVEGFEECFIELENKLTINNK